MTTSLATPRLERFCPALHCENASCDQHTCACAPCTCKRCQRRSEHAARLQIAPAITASPFQVRLFPLPPEGTLA